MSYRSERTLSLQGIDYSQKSSSDIADLFKKVLNNGVHGMCYSAYEPGMKPGDQLTEKSIRRRLGILRKYSKWIRSFSCIEGNELIPPIAKEFGMKTLVGAWLGNDDDLNEKEIQGLISLAKEGYVDIAAVGNEVMYRGELTEEQLLDFIHRVKKAIPGVPVGYVDAYYEFSARPQITEACDVVLANCYPFWEGCHMDYSLVYMKQMYAQAVHAANGKKVIITETGWPSEGSSLKEAQAGRENAIKYFINAQLWSNQDQIEMFYFSSFDESWKVGSEGDVGAYWGIWDENEKLKY